MDVQPPEVTARGTPGSALIAWTNLEPGAGAFTSTATASA